MRDLDKFKTKTEDMISWEKNDHGFSLLDIFRTSRHSASVQYYKAPIQSNLVST